MPAQTRFHIQPCSHLSAWPFGPCSHLCCVPLTGWRWLLQPFPAALPWPSDVHFQATAAHAVHPLRPLHSRLLLDPTLRRTYGLVSNDHTPADATRSPSMGCPYPPHGRTTSTGMLVLSSQGVIVLHCLPPLIFAGVVTRFTLERLSLLHSIGRLTSAQRVASALRPAEDGPRASGAQNEGAMVLAE